MSAEHKQLLESAKKRKKEIARMLKKNVTQAEIARTLGLSPQRVNVIVRAIKAEASK